MKKTLTTMMVAMAAVTAMAEGTSPWNFSIGPAWRARVKSEIGGTASGTVVTPSRTVTDNYGEVTSKNDWKRTEVTAVDAPGYPGLTAFKAPATRVETIEESNGGSAALNGSDVDSPLGLKMSAGYDFY